MLPKQVLVFLAVSFVLVCLPTYCLAQSCQYPPPPPNVIGPGSDNPDDSISTANISRLTCCQANPRWGGPPWPPVP